MNWKDFIKEISTGLFPEIKKVIPNSEISGDSCHIVIPVYKFGYKITLLILYPHQLETKEFGFSIIDNISSLGYASFNVGTCSSTYDECSDYVGKYDPEEIRNAAKIVCKILKDFYTPNSIKFIRSLA